MHHATYMLEQNAFRSSVTSSRSKSSTVKMQFTTAMMTTKLIKRAASGAAPRFASTWFSTISATIETTMSAKMKVAHSDAARDESGSSRNRYSRLRRLGALCCSVDACEPALACDEMSKMRRCEPSCSF